MPRNARTQADSLASRLLVAEEQVRTAREEATRAWLRALSAFGKPEVVQQRAEFRKHTAEARRLERQLGQLRRLARQQSKKRARKKS
jgi:hypothetical protein